MNNQQKKIYQDYRTSRQLPPAAKQRVKDRVFSRLAESLPEVRVSWWVQLSRAVIKSYVLMPLVVIIIVVGVTTASAHALPGDTLYPVKRHVEHVQILLAGSEQAKVQLQEDFAEQRVQELEAVEQHQKPSTLPVNQVPAQSEVEDQSAQTEAEHAVESLEQVKEKLHERGNDTTAEKLTQTISQLKLRLQQNEQRSGRGKDDNKSSDHDRTQHSDHYDDDHQ